MSVSSTSTVPALMKLSALAAASLTLITRLERPGNRSTTRTSTVFPLAKFLTLTHEPIGNRGCAATSSSLFSRLPLAVNPPVALAGKKQAQPVSRALPLTFSNSRSRAALSRPVSAFCDADSVGLSSGIALAPNG